MSACYSPWPAKSPDTQLVGDSEPVSSLLIDPWPDEVSPIEPQVTSNFIPEEIMIRSREGTDGYTHVRGTMSATGIVARTGLLSQPARSPPKVVTKHFEYATSDPSSLQDSTAPLESTLYQQEVGPYFADILPSAGTHPKIVIDFDLNSLGETNGGIPDGLDFHDVASSHSVTPSTAQDNVRSHLHEGLAKAHAHTPGSEYIGQLYHNPAVVPLNDPDLYNRWGRVPWHPVDDKTSVQHHGIDWFNPSDVPLRATLNLCRSLSSQHNASVHETSTTVSSQTLLKDSLEQAKLVDWTQCPQCARRFTGQKLSDRKGHCGRHIRAHHDGKRFRCEECDRLFPSKFNLERHLETQSHINHVRRPSDISITSGFTNDSPSPQNLNNVGFSAPIITGVESL